jgi:DNA-directed RNA polymerase alpha subunit
MSFFNQHDEGCIPADPCARCRAAELLRSKGLDEAELRLIGNWIDRSCSLASPERPVAGNPIPVFPIGTRTRNVLLNHGYTTLEQVARLSEKEFRDMRGLGRKAVNLMEQVLAEHDLQFTEKET